jgi:hypothetical protein
VRERERARERAREREAKSLASKANSLSIEAKKLGPFFQRKKKEKIAAWSATRKLRS